jgi:hypothetical protein
VRAVIVAFVSGAALAATSVQAAPHQPGPSAMGPLFYIPNQEWAPLPSDPPSLIRVAPSVELVAQGCGHGWHRPRWRDLWGYLALGPLYSERGSPRRLERRPEPSLLRLARSLWGLG